MPKDQTANAYAEHVERLALEHAIRIDVRRSTSGRAFDRGEIRIAVVKTERAYAIALHELGHIIDQEAHGRNYTRLHKEVRAWQWARANALEWTARMNWTMRDCLASYADAARRHHWPITEEFSQLRQESRTGVAER